MKTKTKKNIRKLKRILIELSKELLSYRSTKIVLMAVFALVIIIIIVSVASGSKKEEETQPATEATVASTAFPTSYKISGVPVISQDTLKSGCEIYACTMLLQYWDFDIDEMTFADNFLITSPVFYGYGGELYGPDMNSAYAGDVYTGYGINAPAMAKCMNNYIKTTDSKLQAYPLSGVPLEELCEKYILDDKPVMCWETTYMDEPYVKTTWIVDYVDENARYKKGDTESWMQNEHCMVLVDFDEENYYFCDSVSGKLTAYEKEVSEERYSQIGMQAIVVR